MPVVVVGVAVNVGEHPLAAFDVGVKRHCI
jgi:hypothetical protein